MIPFVEAPAAPEPASKQTALLVVSALASAAIALTLAALAYAVAAAGARMLARRIVLALMAVPGSCLRAAAIVFGSPLHRR